MSHAPRPRAGRTSARGSHSTFEPLEFRRLLAAVPSAPEPTPVPGLYHLEALLSQPRADPTVATAGHEVLFAGGQLTGDADRLSDAVDVYDTVTGQWSAGHLSVPRIALTPTVVGSKVLFSGGLEGSIFGHPSRAVDVYDTATGTWSSTTLPQDNDFARPVVVGTKAVFVSAGYVAGTTNTANAVEIYDTITGNWSSGSLSQARADAAIVVVGSRLFVAGGFTGSGTGPDHKSNVVDIYDADTGTWSATTLPRAAGYLSAAAVGHVALFAGGSGTAHKGTIAVDLYDVSTGQWSSADLTGAYVGGGAIDVFGSRAVILTDQTLNVYDGTTAQWTSIPFPSLIPPDQYNPGEYPIALIGSKVFLQEVGAYGDTRLVDIFDLATGERSRHELVEGHGSHLVIGQTLLFAAGRYYDGGPEASAQLEAYDAATGAWAAVTLPNPVGAASDAIRAVGDVAFVSDGGPIDAYDTGTGALEELPTFPSGRSAAGVDLLDGQLLLAGGLASDGTASPALVTAAVDLYTPEAIGEPANPSVADGAGLATAPTQFTWSPAQGASSYDVYLDDHLVAHVTDAHWTVDRPIAPGLHAWQVVARDGGGGAVGGPRWQFTVGAPAAPAEPNLPSGTGLSESPTTLSWSPSVGATSYDVFLDGQRIDTTPYNSTTLTSPVAGGKHTWQVVARNGLTTTPSPLWRFTTPVSGLQYASTPLGFPDNYAVPVTVGNLALFAESNSASSGPTTVWIFNGATNAWSTGALSRPRDLFATAVAGTHALFAGGVTEDGDKLSDAVDVFDALNGTWSTAKLSVARQRAAGAATGHVAAFAGGQASTDFNGPTSDAVDVYDDRTGRWTTAKLSQARVVAATAAVGSMLLFAGGDVSANEPRSDVVDLCDTATGRWSTAHLSAPADPLTSVVAGDRAYFFGNQVIDVYDARTGDWSHTTSPYNLGDAQAVVVNHRAYFIVQYRLLAPNVSDTVAVYDLRTGRWATLSLSDGRSSVPLAVAGSKVVVGASALGHVVDVLDTRTGTDSVVKVDASDQNYSAVAASLGSSAVFLVPNDSNDQLLGERFNDPDAPAPRITGSLTGAPKIAQPGDVVHVTVRLANAPGATAVAGPFTVDVYATTGKRARPGSGTLLGRATVDGPLPAGASTTAELTLRLPTEFPAGHYYLVAAIRGLAGDLTSVDARGLDVRAILKRRLAAFG